MYFFETEKKAVSGINKIKIVYVRQNILVIKLNIVTL